MDNSILASPRINFNNIKLSDMTLVHNLKYFLFFAILTIFSFISCHREEVSSKKTKILRDNIFVKNANSQLFSFDINSKKKMVINL